MVNRRLMPEREHRPVVGPVGWFLVGLVLLGALTGCGGPINRAGGSRTASPAVTTSAGAVGPSSVPSSPATSGSVGGPTSGTPYTPLPGGGDVETQQLTGTVGEGVESGCLILQTAQDSYLLLGDSPHVLQQLRPGATVTVTGYEAPDVMSFCQQGVPFWVLQVRPA